MARKVIVEIIGDSASADRAFGRASSSARGFERSIGRSSRGAIVGSGAFRSLGRSIAFASASFLGAAGLVSVVKSSISQAEELGKATRGLDAQIQANNQNVAAAGPLITRVNLQMAQLGHSSVDSETALSALALATGDVKRGADLMGLAANLAAKRHIDLAKAAVLVGKVVDGNVAALNRYGIYIAKGTTVTDALRIAQQRLAGQAQAATTPLGRLGALAKDLEAALGTVLLPTINRVATAISDWLSKTTNQERVQSDFKQALEGISSTLSAIAGAVRTVTGALGGWKNALTIVIGAWAGFKAAGITSAAAVEFANVAAAAGTAAAWRAALIATGVGALAVAAGIAAAEVIAHWRAVKQWFQQFWLDLKLGAYRAALDIVEPFTHLPRQLGGWARRAKDAMLVQFNDMVVQLARIKAGIDNQWHDLPLPGIRRTTSRSGPGVGAGVGAGGGQSLSPKTKAAVASAASVPYLEYKLAVAEGTKTITDDLKVLREIIAVLTARLSRTKSLQAKTEIVNAINQYTQQEKGLIASVAQATQQVRAARRAAEKAAAEARKAAAARAATRRENKQFAALGFGPGGSELPPSVKGLRKALGSISDAVKGTFLDTGKTRSLLATIRRLLSGALGALSADVRRKIKEMLDNIDQQLKQSGGEASRTKFHKANADAILRGLGLTPEQIRALRARLSTIGIGGTTSTGEQGAFGYAGGDQIVIHHTTTVDGRVVEQVTTKHAQKRHKRNPRQKRGAYAAGTAGI